MRPLRPPARDEVRALSLRSNEFSSQIRAEYAKTRDSMDQASVIVARMASRDMEMTLNSKDRVAELMQEVTGQNVAIAVRSLQFEDMTRQLVDQVRLMACARGCCPMRVPGLSDNYRNRLLNCT